MCLYVIFEGVVCHGVPSSVAHTRHDVITDSQRYGDVIHYQCLLGYHVGLNQDSFNITCQANGSWTEVKICKG